MFDRLADALVESIGIADQSAGNRRCGPDALDSPGSRSRETTCLLFPTIRHVIPAAVEKVLRAGSVYHQLAVNRRLVVPLEELASCPTRPLCLQDAAHEVPAAFGLDERERLALVRSGSRAARPRKICLRPCCAGPVQTAPRHAPRSVHPSAVPRPARPSRIGRRAWGSNSSWCRRRADQQRGHQRGVPTRSQKNRPPGKHCRPLLAVPSDPQYQIPLLAGQGRRRRNSQAHDTTGLVHRIQRRRAAGRHRCRLRMRGYGRSGRSDYRAEVRSRRRHHGFRLLDLRLRLLPGRTFPCGDRSILRRNAHN